MTTAVVVGSGPNGLAAAITLATAGLRVTVLEAGDRPGGGARSTGDPASGTVLQDECSAFHPLALASEFVTGLRLAPGELDWAWAPFEYGHPLDGGGGAVVSQSVAATAAGLGGAAGRSWARLFGPVARSFPTASADLTGPMLRVPRHPLALAGFGLRAAAPASVLGATLRGEAAKALFAGVAAHAFVPLNRPFSSSIGVALGAAAHAYGWPVVRGGTGAYVDVLVRRLTALGGRIELGHRVETAAELDGADVVLLDLAPAEAARVLGDRLPARVARAYRHYRHGPGAFKVDFVLDGEVPWSYEPLRRAATVHLGGSAAEVAAGEAAITSGTLPDRPFVLVGQQQVADPGRCSGGRQPLYSYAHVPHGFRGDATEALIAQIERFAPGFRDRVVSTQVRSTTEMSRYNRNYVGGDITTGANTARQLVLRPRATLDPYATGVPGVWLCSAATPPGAGAHGMCGFHAARRALAQL